MLMYCLAGARTHSLSRFGHLAPTSLPLNKTVQERPGGGVYFVVEVLFSTRLRVNLSLAQMLK